MKFQLFRRAGAWFPALLIITMVCSGRPASGTSLCGDGGPCLRVIYSGNLNGNLAPCG